VLPDDHATTWDDFTARKTAEDAGQPQPAGRNSPRKEPALSALLLQAIHLAGTRRGRLSRAERIREQTLLEVLTEAMRRTK
jgi:hypothetical protein